MWLNKATGPVTTAISSVSRIANVIGQVILVAIMALTVADVFLRYVFSRPIKGSAEVTEYMMVFLALGIAWCALQGRHIRMELIMQRFAARVQAIVDSITLLVSLVVYILITWRIFLETIVVQKTNVESFILNIATYPFYGVLVFGLFMLCLVMIILVAENINKAVKR